MERIINKINTGMITELADLKINSIRNDELITMSNKGFRAVDLNSFCSMSAGSKYWILASIDMGNIWSIKKQNIKANITHLNFKCVDYRKYVKLNNVPFSDAGWVFNTDEYSNIEGVEFTGFDISKLFYSKNIIKSDIVIEFDGYNTELIFSEVKKEPLIKRINKVLRGEF